MDIYLVGGAVRDQLLGLPVTERDWVVVGGSAAELLNLGYKPVGKSFPVFLHPETKEEYALARVERKVGTGYTGFECIATPDISLEDDLRRRDLTINAIAQTLSGEMIDPFNGQHDIKLKLLRHVSSAFSEDPVRILRVARFAARFKSLGFKIAEETLLMMCDMVDAGEVDALIPERVWKEWERALCTDHPMVFFDTLIKIDAFAKLFPEMRQLWNKHHVTLPNETLAKACLVSEDPAVRFACLFYVGDYLAETSDILTLLQRLSNRYPIPSQYQDLVKLMVAHVNQISLHLYDAEGVVSLLESADAFRKPKRFELFLKVMQAIAEVSGAHASIFINAENVMHIFQALSKVSARSLVEQGLSGVAIKTALHDLRVMHLKQLD